MAPKRGRKKVTQVVKTTKVVEETVQVSFLGTQSQEELDLAQTQTQAQAQTPTTEVSERREEQTTVTTKTIPIETQDDAHNQLTQETDTVTDTQEPEVPLDEPMFDKIATPPREEARPRQEEDVEVGPMDQDDQPNKEARPRQEEDVEVGPMDQDDQPNKRGKNSKEEGEAQPQAQNEAQVEKKGKTKVGRKKGRRRMKEVGEGREGYKSYVFKVLKQVHPGMAVSGKAMTVINNLMSDMFERLAAEAARLNTHAKKQTLSAREIQAAVKLVLPGELGKHAIAEGTKAVTNYMNYDRK